MARKRKTVPAPGARRQQGIPSAETPIPDKPPSKASAATIARNKRMALSAKGSMTFEQVKRRLQARKQ